MISEWLGTTGTELWLVLVSSAVIFVAVIASVRIIGLRAFSKMSSFDFAITVAMGSLIASTAASSSVSLANGVVAVAALLGLQALVALGRRHRGLDRFVDNTPMLLMEGPELLDANLDATRVTRDDVIAKLREANVLRMSDVRAVVLETTGDISVLHGSGEVDDVILEGVRRGSGERRTRL